MTSIKNIDNINDKIEALWAMSFASVVKDYFTKEVLHYLCYCDICIDQSIGGKGGRAFITAEDLLTHRKMKAFKCPCGCGFHVCEQRWSIIGHLTKFHPEVLEKLNKERLVINPDPNLPITQRIYPDYALNSYTLTNPMPVLEKSPLENAGTILEITPPKRVDTSSTTHKKPKYVQLDTPSVKESIDTKPPKQWGKVDRPDVSFVKVMQEEQQSVVNEKPKHYAQEDMRKEKQCPNGKSCVKKDRPFACALNHDDNGEIIKCGTLLTDDILCPYERPPFMRCGDGRCTKVHLEHRAKFIEDKKTKYFEKKQSYSNMANVGTKRDATAIITTSDQATFISMSHEDTLGIAIALKELEKQNESENTELNDPYQVFRAESPQTVKNEEDNEDNEDLDNVANFVNRVKKIRKNIGNSVTA